MSQLQDMVNSLLLSPLVLLEAPADLIVSASF